MGGPTLSSRPLYAAHCMVTYGNLLSPAHAQACRVVTFLTPLMACFRPLFLLTIVSAQILRRIKCNLPAGPACSDSRVPLRRRADPTRLPHTELQSYLNSSFLSPPQTSAYCCGLRLREWHHHPDSCQVRHSGVTPASPLSPTAPPFLSPSPVPSTSTIYF